MLLALQFYKIMREKGKLLVPCSTRWLSTERRSNVCFVFVALSLEREGEERSLAKAVGLRRFITDIDMSAPWLMLLVEILSNIQLRLQHHSKNVSIYN